MEEGLVLDLSETCVVQEVAEHETTRLVLQPFLLLEHSTVFGGGFAAFPSAFLFLLGVFEVLLISILLVRNGVLACLLIQFTFHEYVEEHGDRCVIRKLTVYIYRPEERMRVRVLSVRETDQIDRHMADDILLVEGRTDRLADLGQVDRRQTCLRREHAGVHEFRGREFIVGADQLDVAVWLDQERDRWEVELIEGAERRGALNDAASLAELGDVLLPAPAEESGLRQPHLLGEHLVERLLQPGHDTFVHLHLPLAELHDGFQLLNTQ